MSMNTMNQSPQAAKLASGAMVLAVENQPRPVALIRKAVIEGWQCLCGDEIKSGDLVSVAFGSTKVHSGGGLYIVEAGTTDGDNWRGCRRMMIVPQGIAIDIDCEGDWRTFPTVEASGMRVVGTVETVYRPTKYR